MNTQLSNSFTNMDEYEEAIKNIVKKESEKLKKSFFRVSSVITGIENPYYRAKFKRDISSLVTLYLGSFNADSSWNKLANDTYTTSRLIILKELPTSMPKSKPIEFPDLDWFLAHIDSLVDQYNGNWIAIIDCHVVANAPTPKELRAIIKEKNIKRPFVTKASYEAWGVR